MPVSSTDNRTTELHSDEGSSLPDTLSPGAWVPEPISAIPTPHADDGPSNNGDDDVEESSSGGSDTELEDDWKEDYSQVKQKE